DHDPEPDGHEHEREREVPVRRHRPVEPRVHGQPEQEDRERADDELDPAVQEDPRDPVVERPPVLLLEAGRSPARGEREARDDEDDRRPPREQPRGDRQVLAPDERVRERQQRRRVRQLQREPDHDGLTVTFASWAAFVSLPPMWSSSSNSPSSFDGTSNDTLPPFLTGFSIS